MGGGEDLKGYKMVIHMGEWGVVQNQLTPPKQYKYEQSVWDSFEVPAY